MDARSRTGRRSGPYDMGQDVLAEYMGIKADPLDEAVKADFTKVTSADRARGPRHERRRPATRSTDG